MPRYATYATPRADIGQALYEYLLNPADYIGIQAMTPLPVTRKAATFTHIQRESLLRRRDVKRSTTSGYSRDQVDAEDNSYACLEYGHESLLDDGDRANYQFDFDAEEATSMNALHVVLREQEIRIATALFNTTTWTGATLYTDNNAAGVPWTTTTVDIVAQINAGKEKVRTLTGMEPDTLIINQTNLNRMASNDDFIGRIVYNTPATDAAVKAALSQILGLRILVGKGIYNSADEGQAFSASAIWSNLYAMLAVTAPAGANMTTPCVGRCPIWTPRSGSNVVVEQYREESRSSDVFRVRQFVAEKVIDPSYAHLMKIAAS